jgi:hypothetical protein
VTNDQFGEPKFSGDPDTYANLLMKRHQTAGAAGIIDTLINNAPGCGVFWYRVKEVIAKRLKVEAAIKLGKS